MIQYTYNIAQLERDAATGGVKIAHWTLTAQKEQLLEEQLSASVYGTVSFTPDPADESFVPFDELTKEQVIEWVKSQLDTEALEAGLASQIELLENPPVLTGTPWE
jgi:hypothetical protein